MRTREGSPIAVIPAAFLALCLSALAQPTTTYYSIDTVAGSYPLGDGGPATSALLLNARAVAVDGAGNLYIADRYNGRIRKVTPSGVITTVAGGGTSVSNGGQATEARLSNPYGVAVDSAGNLYIADYGHVRKVTPLGVLTTVAGTTLGFSGDGGPATAAQLNNTWGVSLDQVGNLYIADTGNHRIRKVSASGVISTVAGTGRPGFSGDGWPAALAQLNQPSATAVDASGNLYIADSLNHRIRKVTPAGVISTYAGTTYGFGGDGGPARLDGPRGVALDSAGNLCIADQGNSRIRKVTPSGIISTVAGTGAAGFRGDGGPATSAQLASPAGLVVDSAGNVYVADSSSHRIRKLAPSNVITTVAGASHFSGDGGAATAALLQFPEDVAVDAAGDLYIADSSNSRIRKVNPAGVISTVAGGPAAELSGPSGVALDDFGNLTPPREALGLGMVGAGTLARR